MPFHFLFVQISFSLVKVAEWPSSGKDLLFTRLAICSLGILNVVVLVISRFGFESGIWVLLAPAFVIAYL